MKSNVSRTSVVLAITVTVSNFPQSYFPPIYNPRLALGEPFLLTSSNIMTNITGDGDEVCDIGTCSGSKVSYQPAGVVATSFGQIVPCVPVQRKRCVTPRIGASSIFTPAPVASSTSIPSPSAALPSPEPSQIAVTPSQSFILPKQSQSEIPPTPSQSYVAPTPSSNGLPPTPAPSYVHPTPSESKIPPTPSQIHVPPTPSQSELPPTPSQSYVAPTPSSSGFPPTPTTSYVPPTPSQSEIPPTPSQSFVPPTPSQSYVPPTPSISLSPSPIPSPSESFVPLPSPSSSSIPSSPSPSASSVYALIGEDCTASTICERGTTCGCFGKCIKKVKYTLRAMGDDMVVPVVCGTPLLPSTTSWKEVGEWEYEGACDDLYFHVENTKGYDSGVVAAVRRKGKDKWIPTRVDGEDGLRGIVKFDPADSSFFTNSSYDFSGWQAVVEQERLKQYDHYKYFINEYDAQIMCYADGTVPNGISWYRITIPFC